MRRLRVDVVDIVALASLVLLTLGAALIFAPAGFIVAGGLLLAWSIAASRGES